MLAHPVRLLVQRLDPELPLPSHQRPGDAGLDLYLAADVHLEPGERTLAGTGIAVAIPSGFAGFVVPRSGLAARAGLSIVNAPGIVDSGYRGEIKLALVNLDPAEVISLERGERAAQLLVVPVATVDVLEAAELPASERGAGGFGSTGL